MYDLVECCTQVEEIIGKISCEYDFTVESYRKIINIE